MDFADTGGDWRYNGLGSGRCMLHFAIGVRPAASQLSSPALPTIFRLFSLPRLLSQDAAGSASGGLDFLWRLRQHLVSMDILFAQLLFPLSAQERLNCTTEELASTLAAFPSLSLHSIENLRWKADGDLGCLGYGMTSSYQFHTTV